MMCPLDASTEYPRPRNLVRVLDLAGDSTITSDLPLAPAATPSPRFARALFRAAVVLPADGAFSPSNRAFVVVLGLAAFRGFEPGPADLPSRAGVLEAATLERVLGFFMSGSVRPARSSGQCATSFSPAPPSSEIPAAAIAIRTATSCAVSTSTGRTPLLARRSITR